MNTGLLSVLTLLNLRFSRAALSFSSNILISASASPSSSLIAGSGLTTAGRFSPTWAWMTIPLARRISGSCYVSHLKWRIHTDSPSGLYLKIKVATGAVAEFPTLLLTNNLIELVLLAEAYTMGNSLFGTFMYLIFLWKMMIPRHRKVYNLSNLYSPNWYRNSTNILGSGSVNGVVVCKL